jgi:hypothetical protein
MPWLGRDAQGIDAHRLESFRAGEYPAAVLQNVRFVSSIVKLFLE